MADVELLILDGPDAGKRIPLTSDRVVVGRNTGDVVLDDVEVSSVHAMIVHERGGWRILDLGSTNGIYLEGKVQLDGQLRNGSSVTLGKTRMRFQCDLGTSPRRADPDDGPPAVTSPGARLATLGMAAPPDQDQPD